MDNLLIVTDSTADIPPEVVRQYDIAVVPLAIHFGDEQYTDGVDLTAAEFYGKLKASAIMPRTSQPAPGQFVAIYREAVEKGREVLSIHISSKLSGTYQAALLAAEMVGKKHITILDSLSTSMGLGMQVLAAARNGGSLEKAYHAAMAAKENMGLYFLVDTLEYMEKNGRIGKAASLLGSLLRIKPVLTFADGIVDIAEKVRGSNKARQRLLQLLQERTGTAKVDLAVVHADAEEAGRQLLSEAQELVDCDQVYFGPIGPIVGSHGGPGTLGLVFRPALA